jgi:hypothetical protein
MPTAALRRSRPDEVLGLSDMPTLLEKLVHEPAGAAVLVPKEIEHEVEIAKCGSSAVHRMDRARRRAVGAPARHHGGIG